MGPGRCGNGVIEYGGDRLLTPPISRIVFGSSSSTSQITMPRDAFRGDNRIEFVNFKLDILHKTVGAATTKCLDLIKLLSFFNFYTFSVFKLLRFNRLSLVSGVTLNLNISLQLSSLFFSSHLSLFTTKRHELFLPNDCSRC